MRKLIRPLFILSLLACAPMSYAQGKAPASMADDLNKIVLSSCPGAVDNIIKDPKLAPLMRGRSIKTQICSCTEARFKADTRLQEQFNVGLLALDEKMKQKSFEAYFTTRLMSAMFSCIADGLDKVLAEADPSQ